MSDVTTTPRTGPRTEIVVVVVVVVLVLVALLMKVTMDGGPATASRSTAAGATRRC